tara:strand:- start:80 stop:934 length:855 start_codon:yes stop_codon:yes gene_type:complete
MFWVARREAARLVTHLPDERPPIERTPADVGMDYRDVQVTTSDGLRLAGWWTPSKNGAAVIVQHGYKTNRSTQLLEIAATLARGGYGVLLSSLRAHDLNDGRVISFGLEEMKDLSAWLAFIQTLEGVDPSRIGIFGNSLGGSLAIQLAAQTQSIKAIVTHSAVASVRSTVATSIAYFTGLPPFPFTPMILFWVEQDWAMEPHLLDFTMWIAALDSQPILLMQGGADVVVAPESGQLLYDAAREPKELWFEPDLGHVDFQRERSQEFSDRVVGFFDRHLLNPENE